MWKFGRYEKVERAREWAAKLLHSGPPVMRGNISRLKTMGTENKKFAERQTNKSHMSPCFTTHTHTLAPWRLQVSFDWEWFSTRCWLRSFGLERLLKLAPNTECWASPSWYGRALVNFFPFLNRHPIRQNTTSKKTKTKPKRKLLKFYLQNSWIFFIPLIHSMNERPATSNNYDNNNEKIPFCCFIES